MRVYVAGKISDPDFFKMLRNIWYGQNMGLRLMLKYGYAVFNPFMDYQYIFHNVEGGHLQDDMTVDIDELRKNSMASLGMHS